MGITADELPGGITRVILEGNVGIEGAAAIDLQMNVIAGTHRDIMVELQKVSFIGSMGLRALLSPWDPELQRVPIAPEDRQARRSLFSLCPSITRAPTATLHF
jgi:hypothetical protein